MNELYSVLSLVKEILNSAVRILTLYICESFLEHFYFDANAAALDNPVFGTQKTTRGKEN